MTAATIDHSPPHGADGPGPTVAEAETWLTEWFAAPVVLTSSGRGALRLVLAKLGLNRYRDRIAMSPMTAACVFDAVIRHGFPVDPAVSPTAAATVLIQQYGFVQGWRPAGLVVEDISHAFFAGPSWGARDWAGDFAVFSLPKFFGLAGMAGGIVCRNHDDAGRLHEQLAESIPRRQEEAARDRAIFRNGAGAEIEAVYLRNLLDSAPDPGALAGLPAPPGMVAIGHRRAEILERFLDITRPDGSWPASLRRVLPYVFPVFGQEARLRAIAGELTEAGISAGVYRVDDARDNRRPAWRPALLAPCHHAVPEGKLAAIEDAARAACDPGL